nr:hypothetical protein [Pseudomonas amygdali]
MSILVILLRMALHKLPHESMAASSWLSLGPIGTGALGMLVLGSDAPAIFAAHGMAGIGGVAEGIGLIGGVLFWGLDCGGWFGAADYRSLLQGGYSFQPRLVGFTFR